MSTHKPAPGWRPQGARPHRPVVVKTGPGAGVILAWLLLLIAIGGACYWLRQPISTQIQAALGNAPQAVPSPAPAFAPKPIPAPAPALAPAPVIVQDTPEPVDAKPDTSATSQPEIAQAAPASAATPAQAPYPGLPKVTLSLATAAGDPDYARLVKATQWVVENGGWDQHRKALDDALLAAATSRGWMQYQFNIDAILTQQTPSLMLAQDAVLHAIDPNILESMTKDPDTGRFLNWLFTTPRAATLLAQTITPWDNAQRVLEIWRDCWKSDPDGAAQYMSLALAVAVVFDQPVKVPASYYSTKPQNNYDDQAADNTSVVDPVQRYQFYRTSDKRGALRAPLAEMLPDELVWVVDAAVPNDELLWAQQNLRYQRSDWGDAYGSIRYRMDKATNGTQLYDRYTLAQIKQQGGICEDQAYFASVTAKANGIPAMIVAGEGDRGGHAWVQWESNRDTWSESGRYADNYAAGTSPNPQTHETEKEQEIRQSTLPQRRTDAWARANSYLQLSVMLAAKPEIAKLALNAAVRNAPENLDAWNRLLDGLVAAKSATNDWETAIGRMRVAFQKYPDIIGQINKRETDYLATTGDAKSVESAARRQENRFTRDDKSRTDLITGSVFQQADLAMKSGDTEAAGRIFRQAMRDKGNEAVPFKSIARQYYDWAHQQNDGAKAVREIEMTFQRNFHADGDYFALGEYSGMLDFVIDLYQKEGMDTDAHRLTSAQKQIQRRLAAMKNSAKQAGSQG